MGRIIDWREGVIVALLHAIAPRCDTHEHVTVHVPRVHYIRGVKQNGRSVFRRGLYRLPHSPALSQKHIQGNPR